MAKIDSVQEPFLNSIRKSKSFVYIYLTNGKKLQGKVEAFDTFALLLKGSDDNMQLVYKHAISTILPAQSPNIRNRPRPEDVTAESPGVTLS